MLRSLITLKALTYAPTGGIVAAPTTSLPEEIGGVRNWDYRYCWLRDVHASPWTPCCRRATTEEAAAWRDWLLRAVAGDPADLQIMYGLAGERRLPEFELPWLAGYEGSRPSASATRPSTQLQLDVYGEVIDSLAAGPAARAAVDEPHAWTLQRRAARTSWSRTWREPDEGLWEVRGPRRHFVHSKVMAWVAVDRAVRSWRRTRSSRRRPRRLARDARRGPRGGLRARATTRSATPSPSTTAPASSTPRRCSSSRVGFLPPDDPRVVGTVDAVRDELGRDGFVRRYSTDGGAVDGLPGDEGAFLACSFWLVDALRMTGRTEEARALFERLLGLANDVGLLAEEYDPVAGRQLGNFPQAFSHIGLVNTAVDLAGEDGRIGPWILD